MRFLAALLLISSSQAFAAGYTCLSVDGDTQVIVYFVPETATPVAPVAKQVVFIDPTLSKKTQVSALFESAKGVLKTQAAQGGVVYHSVVDSAQRPGKHLGGTRVGFLSQVAISVQIAAENIRTLTEGRIYSAEVTYTKKSGQALAQDFDCTLFLSEEAPDIAP